MFLNIISLTMFDGHVEVRKCCLHLAEYQYPRLRDRIVVVLQESKYGSCLQISVVWEWGFNWIGSGHGPTERVDVQQLWVLFALLYPRSFLLF